MPYLPHYLSDYGYARLITGPWMHLWGSLVGKTLKLITSRCIMRTKSRVYMESATFVSLLLRKGDVFFDVGAYDGLISMIGAYAVQKAGRVHSFEPNPVPFKIMRQCINSYGFRWVTLNLCALSDHAGNGVLYIPASQSGGTLSSSATMFLSSKQEHQSQVECKMQTLDQYINNCCHGRNPDLIKIDVEGAELEVLRGGEKIFSRPSPPMIVFEAWSIKQKDFGRTVNDVMDWLSIRGYMFYILRYPFLIKVSKEADIVDKSAAPQWTDILAFVPEIHKHRMELLHKRFKLMNTVS